ncbi:hypothetical protein MMC13_004197 [Lambiella insularis]|nr:hypothetical protein [Lambiella insularis]
MWRIDMRAWTSGKPNPVTLVANLTDVGLPDGIATLDNEIGLVLLAYAARGIVWRVDTTTGHYTIAIQDELFTTNNQLISLGVDGVLRLNHDLYFTNFGNNAFGRVTISPNGSAIGPVELIADMTIPDDFAIADDGTAYIAGDNSLYRVSQKGTVDILVGGPNSLVVEGCTSAQLGRTRLDKDVLYIGTNGGILAPVDGQIHGGQLIAVNVDLTMRFLALLPLASLALSAPLLEKRLCSATPSTFSINDYAVFTQSANQQGFSPTYGSSIRFNFQDSITNVTTSCGRSLAPMTGSVADASNFYSCASPAVQYMFNGTTLTVREIFDCHGKTQVATGSAAGGSDCYPEEPPVPLGYGTQCVYAGETSADDIPVTSVKAT